jgi:hypothetical protein
LVRLPRLLLLHRLGKHSTPCSRRSHGHGLCVVVVSTRKCEMNAVAYFSKMKGFTDEMVATGKPLEDEDFIAHLLAGLDYDYNSFIENISARSDLLMINDVLAH